MNLFEKKSKMVTCHLNSDETVFVARIFHFIIQKMIYTSICKILILPDYGFLYSGEKNFKRFLKISICFNKRNKKR